MLEIVIPLIEFWDEKNEVFVYADEQKLQIEHSLLAISKWESKWHKPFLTKSDKTLAEFVDYIRCMTITENVDPEIYNRLTAKNIQEIEEYMGDSMTASTVPEEKNTPHNREQVTSELVYYWMLSLGIPPEYETWHFNRLIILIRICNFKNRPPKKHSKRDIYSRHAAINAANKKRFNSKG